jgi:hypothetical protein
MEIFNIIIAIVLVAISLTSERLRVLFRLFLSGVTGFFILKIPFFYLRLISPQEYSFSKIETYFNSGMFIYSLIAFGVSYLIFYWGFYLFFIRITDGWLSKFYKNHFNRLSLIHKRNVAAFLAKFTKRWVLMLMNMGIARTDHHSNWEDLKYSEMRNDICNYCVLFFISSSAVFCSILNFRL